jgi:hypothetical protein
MCLPDVAACARDERSPRYRLANLLSAACSYSRLPPPWFNYSSNCNKIGSALCTQSAFFLKILLQCAVALIHTHRYGPIIPVCVPKACCLFCCCHHQSCFFFHFFLAAALSQPISSLRWWHLLTRARAGTTGYSFRTRSSATVSGLLAVFVLCISRLLIGSCLAVIASKRSLFPTCGLKLRGSACLLRARTLVAGLMTATAACSC